MNSHQRISNLVSSQLPSFIRDDHPIFVEFLQKYYEFLENPGGPVYELKRFSDNYNIDAARAQFLQYFKQKILPSFPEKTELSTEKIIKAARDFYAKKGTPDSFKFLFQVLYGIDVEIFFPKLQILKASDGKWILPQAFRITLSAANENLDLNLIEKRKAYGSVSKASCIIESADRSIDKSTNREIIEVYVSNINRLFLNGEYLEIEYEDNTGTKQFFSEKIIGSLSNIRINPNRRGTKYSTGDPVVINGGLDESSPTKVKAVAYVGNVSTGSIDSVTVLNGGYGFRAHPNSLIDIVTTNGVGANLIISGVDTGNAISQQYNIDSIYYKAATPLNSANYSFDNVAISNSTTTLSSALTFRSISTYPITSISVINGGSFFDAKPTLNTYSLYESDFYEDNQLITINPGSFTNYNNVSATLQLSGAYSTTDGWYEGFRVLCEKHSRRVTGYIGSTKTLILDRPFENNITPTNILTKTLYLDSRPYIASTGSLAKVVVQNGGSGYLNGDTVLFTGTGYGAVATLTTWGGIITGVNLTNRGEGYVEAPNVSVLSGTGTGAILKAFVIGDGEDLDVVTGDIGQIRDIVLVNRGSDYSTTPNVSLKIYDLYLAPIAESESIFENEIVYQGPNINSTTFKATVDSYSKTDNILRVFNFSGTPSPGTLTVYKPAGANITTATFFATVNGKAYPYKYGDGKAKANAEFLNGLIKYNGFYLNTDGHISADKKLQDDTKYHNFSYSLISDASYVDYGKTVYDVLHPTGTKLIPVRSIKDDKIVYQSSNSNSHMSIETANSLVNTCNVGFDSNNVVGVSEAFDTLADPNDLIVINSANTYRSFTKVITLIGSQNSLNIESSCVIIGEGRAKTTAGSPILNISGNSNAIIRFIATDDLLRVNVNNSIVVRSVSSITGNNITMNSTISTSNSNLIYEVLPKLNVVEYKIIKTIF